MNEKFHIQISDFGSAFHGSTESIKPVSLKQLEKRKLNEEQEILSRKSSFVGTAQYVSPEMLKFKNSSVAVDLWALGIIIYQMMTGETPFKEMTEFLIFKKILSLDYSFPKKFNQDGKKLIQSLLIIDPVHRLGACDDFGRTNSQYSSIRSHSFFNSVQAWDAFYQKSSPLIDLINCDDLNANLKRSSNLDEIKPGLDESQLSRLLGLDLCDDAFNLNILSPQNWPNHTKMGKDNHQNLAKIDQPLSPLNLDKSNQATIKSNFAKKKSIFSKLLK